MKKVTNETALRAVEIDDDVRRVYTSMMAQVNGLDSLQGLAARCAFLQVMCGRLECDVLKGGYVDAYDNGGGQRGRKRSVAADLYSVYSKLYLAAQREWRLAGHGHDDDADEFDRF